MTGAEVRKLNDEEITVELGNLRGKLLALKNKSVSEKIEDSTQFGKIRKDIARSRIEIEQTRLLTLKAARMMDTVGNKVARQEIAMIKAAAPSMALRVLDRAIQVHGAKGVSQDSFLAAAWAHQRTLRLADGPDEVHLDTIAKLELKNYASKR